MAKREHIPNELQRQLMLEVGFRCPICSATEPLEFEHIEDYAEVKKHEFSNMIVLCASCHGRKRKGSNPRDINRASLRKLKNNLMMLNGRYSDLERRIIDEFKLLLRAYPDRIPAVLVHHTMRLLVTYLERDRIVTMQLKSGGVASNQGGIMITNDQLLLTLTAEGRLFVETLMQIEAEQ